MMNCHGVIVLSIICYIWSVNVFGQYDDYFVNDFGGTYNRKVDHKQAFENAWKKACATPGGVVTIPKGTYPVSRGEFGGPCVGPTLFILDGTLVAGGGSSFDRDFWLTFKNVDGLTISGTGTLDGNGPSAWARCMGSEECGPRPTLLKMVDVTYVVIQGIRFVNSKMFHLHIHEAQNVNVKNVQILAPEDSPNTDGIHVSRSNNVKIEDSFIGTGDDCVSIGHGSRKVLVSRVFCGPGHGISIGSLGKYEYEENVRGITVRNCTLTKTDNGLRIKTWAPSKSSIVVSDVKYSNIIMNSVRNPILIDQHYCPSGSCGRNGESGVQIRGVTYIGVRGSSSEKTSVDIQCSKMKPCLNINLIGVKITYNGQPTTAICSPNVQFRGLYNIPRRC